MRKMKTKDGREITVPEKGERHPGSGRVKGKPNGQTLAQREAMFWAAEHSKHSADQTLQGYYLFLADEFPQAMGNNLNRLLPLQVNQRVEVRQKVVYKTSAEIIEEMHARGMSPQLIEAIIGALASKPPEPIDHSQPRDLVAHPLPGDDVKPGLFGDREDNDGGDGADALDPEWNSAVASRRS
jgi:hypothetical protein